MVKSTLGVIAEEVGETGGDGWIWVFSVGARGVKDRCYPACSCRLGEIGQM